MSATPADASLRKQIISKPNRAAIVRTIGEQGEVGFKELKGRLNLGVGTLYYHLDGLTGYVTQNSSKQYMLTDQGEQLYEEMKGMEGIGKPLRRPRLPRFSRVLGEVFFFDSHIERLSIDSMSSISLTIGILFGAALLAGMTRVEAAMFFIRARNATATFAFFMVFWSWFLIFVMGAVLVTLFWRSRPNLLALAGGSALSMIPVTFALFLEGVRRVFTPDFAFLNTLYLNPYFLIFQVVLVLWGAYIFTLSMRSATSLNFERTLVVALLVVLVNLGYLWGRPLLFPGGH